jgi:hypothetical protein
MQTTPLTEAWNDCLRRAIAKARAARLRKVTFRATAAVLPVTVLSVLLLGLDRIEPAVALFLVGSCVTVPCLATLVAALVPPKKEAVLREIDRRFGIADGAEAATEFAGQDPEFWREATLAQTLRALETANWSERWPIAWPGRTRLVFSLQGLAAIGVVGLIVMQPAGSGFADSPEDANAARVQALVDLVEEWEQRPDTPETADWAAFEQDLAQARENLRNPDFDEREVLLELSRIEDRLREMLEQSAPEIAEAMRLALAESFAGMSGFEALTEALAEGDLDIAQQELEGLAEKVADESLPLDPSDAETQEMLDRLAESADGLRSTESASLAEWADRLEEFGDAVEAGDCEAAGACLAGMGEEIGKSGQEETLAALLAQLDAAREAFLSPDGEGEEPISRMAGLDANGDEAGTGSVDDPFGDESPFTRNYHEEDLSGTPQADGESRRRTVSTDEGRPDRAVRDHVAADLVDLDRLSREAIENESIPLAHRRTIQRYFQSIRPGSGEER